MKSVTILSVILDLVVMVLFLTLPRTGMEAMGTAFLLIPLLAVRGMVALIGLAMAWRRRHKPFMAYTLVSLAVMAGLWTFGWSLKPRDKPLYRALGWSAREQASRLSDHTDRIVYGARRLLMKTRDPGHARLCDLLADERDAALLEEQLALEPDLSKTCVTFDGDRVAPVLHAVIHSYGPWPEGPTKRPPVDTKRLDATVRLLLDHGADPNARDRHGNTPLHYALIFQEEPLVDVLLAGGACVFLKNDKDESPARLHASPLLRKKIRAAANDPAMVARCPDLHRTTAEKSDSTPDGQRTGYPQLPPDAGLLDALRSGRMEEAADYLSQGADPNAVDKKGSTLQAAMRLCRDHKLAMMQMLLKAGADVNLRNRRGETPLKIAAFDCIRAVPFLLEQGADPTLADNAGDTALHGIVKYKAETMSPLLDGLLQAGADINHQNRHGQTPLVKTAHAPCVRDEAAALLLASGADPNMQDYRGDTLLHILAAEKGRTDPGEMVRLLLDRGAGLEIRNRMYMTPLMAAAARKNVKIAKMLIDSGSDVNVRSKRGNPLIGSLISCDPEKLAILKLLAAAGADVAATSEYGPLPLAQAFYNHLHLDCLEPARVLLNAGADPNRQDRNGAAPIHSLAYWSEKDPVPALALLLDHGARIDIRNQQAMTALLLAARYGSSLGPIRALLERGADADAVDNAGNTLLHCLAMNAKPGVTQRLAFALAIGADPAAANHKGERPIDLARRMDNLAAVNALMAADE